MSDTPTNSETTISGIDVMRGVGAKAAKGFWADAWDLVIVQWGARLALAWIAIVGFFAIVAPFIANGLPIWTVEYDLLANGNRGEVVRSFSPLWENLSSIDVLLLIGLVLGIPWMALPISVIPLKRSHRLGILCVVTVQAGLTAAIAWGLSDYVRGDTVSEWLRNAENEGKARWYIPFIVAIIIAAALLWIPTFKRFGARVALVCLVLVVSGLVSAERWNPPIANYDRFIEGEVSGKFDNTYTLIPWSPNQSRTDMYLVEPMLTVDERLELSYFPEFLKVFNEQSSASKPSKQDKKQLREIYLAAAQNGEDFVEVPAHMFGAAMGDEPHRISIPFDEIKIKGPFGQRRFLLGTDAVGQDVLSQMLHACRLSISIGLVSTGISVLIGIVIGSLMGYFGGWVDLLLSRIVEVFMAIPVLFLLIVAAAVLPRNTYVMMIIIGCVSWTLSARFIRAEFLKLRSQDFVQAARAAGLPLRSVLFKHMLPNGVTPVLVQASFAIAVAILAEATLSFLGLGPVDQASWGKLLSSATSVTGTYIWWLAIFPGLAIFLTVLAYNLLGEAFQGAIDPKLRKAAH